MSIDRADLISSVSVPNSLPDQVPENGVPSFSQTTISEAEL